MSDPSDIDDSLDECDRLYAYLQRKYFYRLEQSEGFVCGRYYEYFGFTDSEVRELEL